MSTDAFTTTNSGAPVASDEHSQTVGTDGPIALHDHYLVEKLAQFNREKVPERIVHAKGGGAFGTFVTTDDVSQYTRAALFQPGASDRHARALLDRRRRAGQPRHLARPPRLRAEVLHRRGQLRPRRQQHARLLHPRRHQVPRLHPLAEAPARLAPARPRHAVGLLDPLARVGPPGHLADGRPRPARLLAHDGRLRLAHLPVDQRRRRAVLGEVPLQDPPGQRDPDAGPTPTASPAKTPTSTSATCPRRSSAATSRAGRCQRAGHALRRRRDVPLQPVRPDEGVAAQRLPAASRSAP